MPQFHTLRSYRNNGGAEPQNQQRSVPGSLASSVIVEKEKHTEALVRQETRRQKVMSRGAVGPRGSLLLRPGAANTRITRDLRNPVSDAPMSDAAFKDPSTTSLQIDQLNRSLQVIDQSRSLQVSTQNSRYVSLTLPLQKGGRFGQGKAALVIPGKQKRSHETTEQDVRHSGHLSVHWRHATMVVATICIFLFCMISLTPIGSSVQATFTLRQVQPAPIWNIASRYNQGSTTKASGAVGSEAYYRSLAAADAEKYGISPYYYVRQIEQESHFDPNAVSFAGAVGIAQFEPETARELGFDPHDPVQALDGGARFMAQLNNEFGGDYRKALAAYNAGPGAVDNAVSACGAAWLSCMDGQPQAYVYIIMGY